MFDNSSSANMMYDNMTRHLVDEEEYLKMATTVN